MLLVEFCSSYSNAIYIWNLTFMDYHKINITNGRAYNLHWSPVGTACGSKPHSTIASAVKSYHKIPVCCIKQPKQKAHNSCVYDSYVFSKRVVNKKAVSPSFWLSYCHLCTKPLHFTHWPLGDAAVVLNWKLSNSYQRQIYGPLSVNCPQLTAKWSH